jgi:hypothetical protein
LKDKKQIINDKTLMANNQNTNEQKPSSTPSFDEVDDPV